MRVRFLVGIDEAGRAPLAGPVAVGAVMVRVGFDWSLIGGIRDSKRMTATARERFFQRMLQMRREGLLQFVVTYASHASIDDIGITAAISSAIARALRRLNVDPLTSNIFLDGLLSAPEQFAYQQTIIGGDDVLPVISMAAVAAKVSRDHLMHRLANKYPMYGFDSHKGYPTRQHRRAIEIAGLSPIHRVTYCRSLQLRQHAV